MRILFPFLFIVLISCNSPSEQEPIPNGNPLVVNDSLLIDSLENYIDNIGFKSIPKNNFIEFKYESTPLNRENQKEIKEKFKIKDLQKPYNLSHNQFKDTLIVKFESETGSCLIWDGGTLISNDTIYLFYGVPLDSQCAKHKKNYVFTFKIKNSEKKNYVFCPKYYSEN